MVLKTSSISHYFYFFHVSNIENQLFHHFTHPWEPVGPHKLNKSCLFVCFSQRKKTEHYYHLLNNPEWLHAKPLFTGSLCKAEKTFKQRNWLLIIPQTLWPCWNKNQCYKCYGVGAVALSKHQHQHPLHQSGNWSWVKPPPISRKLSAQGTDRSFPPH